MSLPDTWWSQKKECTASAPSRMWKPSLRVEPALATLA
jgi:hypothetical protein